MPVSLGGSVHQSALVRVQADTQWLLACLLRWQTLSSHSNSIGLWSPRNLGHENVATKTHHPTKVLADFTQQDCVLRAGVHVLLVDLLPPGLHDPHGLHGMVLQEIEDSEQGYDLPAAEPLTLASYVSDVPVEVYLEHAAVGADLPEMPLFLRPDRYVNVPLAPTYQAAYRGFPAFWQEVLERPG
jgi:hypothetical protein